MTGFEDHLAAVFGADLDRFLAHPDVPTFVRANPLNLPPERLPEVFDRYGLELERHPVEQVAAWQVVGSRHGHSAGVCLHHFLGAFAIQSIGSMIPPILLDPQPGERILDLCASPGSKTSEILTLMQGRGRLWANDLNSRRMSPLAAVLDATGAASVSLINRDGVELPKLVREPFDRVLADVPCTGLGCRDNLTQNRAYFERRGGPSGLPDLQYRLLMAAVRLVREGGRVVYSTCSLDPAENEAVVDAALRRLPVRLVEPRDLAGLHLREGRTEHGAQRFDPSLALTRRLCPWENPSEGFFVAVLEKTGPLSDRHNEPDEADEASAWTDTLAPDHPDAAAMLEQLARTYGIPVERFEGWRYLISERRSTMVPADQTRAWGGVMRAGAALGRRSGGDWRLSHTAVQRFREDITRNRVDLSRAQLEELAERGTCDLLPSQEEPTTLGPALAFDGVGGPFARGVWNKGRLRWKKPRRYVLPTVEG